MNKSRRGNREAKKARKPPPAKPVQPADKPPGAG